MILWNDAFKPHYTFIDDMLILANLKDENTPMFNFPIGNGNAQPAIDKLITASKQNNYTFKMVYLTVEMKEMLEAMYPNQFEFEERRENFDYIYNVEDLLHLKGKNTKLNAITLINLRSLITTPTPLFDTKTLTNA